MKPRQRAAAAAVLALLVTNSPAANFAVGALPAAPMAYAHLASEAPGTISDVYFFTIASPQAVYGSVSSVDLPPLFNVGSLNLKLYNISLSEMATGTGTGEDSTISGAALPAGGYYFVVSGTATGPGGGFAAFAAYAMPIPEPGRQVLLLAGLGVVGYVSLRKRRAGAPVTSGKGCPARCAAPR